MKTKTKTPATVVDGPRLHKIVDPSTQQVVPHIAYRALLEYVTKPPQERLIICSSLDTVDTSETVFVSYHTGLQLYQHDRATTVSDCQHCAGGFYFLNGVKA